jgi:hypothetical protein
VTSSSSRLAAGLDSARANITTSARLGFWNCITESLTANLLSFGNIVDGGGHVPARLLFRRPVPASEIDFDATYCIGPAVEDAAQMRKAETGIKMSVFGTSE